MLNITHYQRNANQNCNEVITSHWPEWPSSKKKKKSTNNKYWIGWREKGTLLHCWREFKMIQRLWKTVWTFFKKKKTRNKTTI